MDYFPFIAFGVLIGFLAGLFAGASIGHVEVLEDIQRQGYSDINQDTRIRATILKRSDTWTRSDEPPNTKEPL